MPISESDTTTTAKHVCLYFIYRSMQAGYYNEWIILKYLYSTKLPQKNTSQFFLWRSTSFTGSFTFSKFNDISPSSMIETAGYEPVQVPRPNICFLYNTRIFSLIIVHLSLKWYNSERGEYFINRIARLPPNWTSYVQSIDPIDNKMRDRKSTRISFYLKLSTGKDDSAPIGHQHGRSQISQTDTNKRGRVYSEIQSYVSYVPLFSFVAPCLSSVVLLVLPGKRIIG